MDRCPRLRVLLEIALCISARTDLLIERDIYKASIIIIGHSYSASSRCDSMDVGSKQLSVEPVFIRIFCTQQIFGQFFLLEQSLAERCLHGFQQRLRLLSDQIGCLTIREKVFDTFRQTVKI